MLSEFVLVFEMPLANMPGNSDVAAACFATEPAAKGAQSTACFALFVYLGDHRLVEFESSSSSADQGDTSKVNAGQT